VSFLNQLKSQARVLQSKQSHAELDLAENTAQTEEACRFALQYLQDLAKHLNVIAPKAPRFSLDGKTPWPAMKLIEFRVDSRKKMLRHREVFATYPAAKVRAELLDELAKLIVGEPNRFV